MPITSSAKKALRVSFKKAVFNTRRMNAVEQEEKKLKKLLAKKDVKGAEALMPKIQQAIDKAAKRGVIKPNTASRKKSRIVAMIKKLK